VVPDPAKLGLAVKLRRLADICEPGNLVNLDDEAFDTGHPVRVIRAAANWSASEMVLP
jgi:hypothetical protein